MYVPVGLGVEGGLEHRFSWHRLSYGRLVFIYAMFCPDHVSSKVPGRRVVSRRNIYDLLDSSFETTRLL